MTAVTVLKAWEEVPNCDLAKGMVILPNTTDQTHTCTITLADHGIGATGLLWVLGWVHTTDGSVITLENVTTSVTSGVLTVTIPAGTDNNTRIIEFCGRADTGVFA